MSTCVFQTLSIKSAGPEQTKILQHFLGIKEDGIFGTQTEQTVYNWQKNHGITPTGIADKTTCQKMGIWCATPPTPSTFNVGYFINPDSTPLEDIDWTALKNKGINEVYVRVMNSNYNQFGSYLAAIKKAGIKTYAWVWEGFAYTSFLTLQGWNILMDMETYEMLNYYSEIKGIQNICKANNKTFILCTKADGLDGDQKWSTIQGYCDWLMPMLYLNDYGMTIESLTAYMQKYNKVYPGKIYPALETYVSDENVVPKTNTALMAEVNAVKPYCKGVALFRYGLSNF